MGISKIETRSSPVNNNIINSLLLCSFTALFCSLLWIIPLPQASSSLLSVFFLSLSQTTTDYSINFLTPTSVFILGNLIVVLLIGESKILSSKTSDGFGFGNEVCFYEGSFREASICEGDEKTALEKCDDDDDDDDDLGNNCEDLSKRADDFIARVNMQREIEAMMITYSRELTTMKKKFKNKGFNF